MKRVIPLILLVFLVMNMNCKSNREISFCEGVSPEGKGVSCGSTFTTGDITALIMSKENFEVDKIELTIQEKKPHKYELVETMYLNVDPDKNSAAVNLSFYNEGAFKITAKGKEGRVLGEGDIKIIDTY